MTRAAWAIVFALVLAACGGSAPAAANTALCDAFRELASLQPEFQRIAAAGDDAAAIDVILVTVESKAARAVDLIANAPDWPPGDALATAVSDAGAGFVLAARQFRDRDVDGATATMGRATDRLDDATAALEGARAAGLSC